MAKINNPYSTILDEIAENKQIHMLEAKRVRRDVLEARLEEVIERLENDPKIAQIKAKKHISEEEQVELDTNQFEIFFLTEKLNTSVSFEKELKKLDEIQDSYKQEIEKRISKFELNASIVSKFTEEELANNPHLVKMLDTGSSSDAMRKKYVKQESLVTELFAKYVGKNIAAYAEQLQDFIKEQKTFRQALANPTALKVNEDLESSEEEVTKEPEVKQTRNVRLSGSVEQKFEILKEIIMHDDSCDEEQLNELKSYVARVLDHDELVDFNKLEEELVDEYQKYNTVDGMIGKRLKVSLDQFNIGVDEIIDLIADTMTPEGFVNAIEMKLNGEIFAKNLTEIKADPAYLNRLAGISAMLHKYVIRKEEKAKSNLFGRKIFDEQTKKARALYEQLAAFLINEVGFEVNLARRDLIGTLITEDKKDELAYVLMNNAVAISNTSDISDWRSSVLRLLSHCILEIIDAAQNGKNPNEVIYRYHEQYGKKEVEQGDNTSAEEKRKNAIRSAKDKDDQASAIKNILR